MLGRAQAVDASVEAAIRNLVRDGVHDFYSVHVMSYCEGYFEPSASISLGNPHPKRKVTGCSNRTALFHFEPSEALSRDLDPGVNLSGINWPDAIDDDFSVLEVTSKTMTVLYCIGTGATGVAVLAGAWLILSRGRLEAIVEAVFTIVRVSSPSTSKFRSQWHFLFDFFLKVIATKPLRIYRPVLSPLESRPPYQQSWHLSLSTLSTDMEKILACRPIAGHNSQIGRAHV